jgi:hypothetical protein
MLSVSFFADVVRGSCEIHKGPLRSRAEIQLLQCTDSNGGKGIGSFVMECRGMLNTTENATLQLIQDKITFSRRGFTGEWKMNDRPVAQTTIGLGRRWLYWGHSTTRINGTVLRVTMPVFGPSTRQLSNCICTALVSDGTRIRMFLAKPEGEQQFLFDRSEVGLLERLSEEGRLILLGELLRVRSIYS